MSGLSWDSVLQETDVQKAFDVFYAGAMSLFDQYYPMHTISHCLIAIPSLSPHASSHCLDREIDLCTGEMLPQLTPSRIE